ncbi:MAG: hypothetical protein AAFO73_08905 [Pseudomonadota bacterium]
MHLKETNNGPWIVKKVAPTNVGEPLYPRQTGARKTMPSSRVRRLYRQTVQLTSKQTQAHDAPAARSFALKIRRTPGKRAIKTHKGNALI